jgi:hypothetical protein
MLCDYHSVLKEYKVLKIKSLKNAYLITVEDIQHKFYFSVISLKSHNQEGERIKRAKQYMFQLDFCDPPNPNVIYVGTLRQSYFDINGVTVYIPYKTNRWEMATTINLNGLYYIKSCK